MTTPDYFPALGDARRCLFQRRGACSPFILMIVSFSWLWKPHSRRWPYALPARVALPSSGSALDLGILAQSWHFKGRPLSHLSQSCSHFSFQSSQRSDVVATTTILPLSFWLLWIITYYTHLHRTIASTQPLGSTQSSSSRCSRKSSWFSSKTSMSCS
jgi:hypothetical protein